MCATQVRCVNLHLHGPNHVDRLERDMPQQREGSSAKTHAQQSNHTIPKAEALEANMHISVQAGSKRRCRRQEH